ncbi:MAG TPA: hypothetical protein VMF68_12090 [Spirochaetia bacterium]|nr:hypothetical protein [Spirochaetia bacterium]
MKRVVVRLALLAALAATLGGCSDAIYAAIDKAQKTATNTLSQTMSVFDIAVPASGTYYVAAGAIFQGTLSGSTVDWTPNTSTTSRPWNPTGLICNAMTLFGANLYGGFVASDGTPSLYQSSAGFSFASGATPLTTQTPGEQITSLSAANGRLFVGGASFSSASNAYVYQLESSATGTAPWNTIFSPGQAYPFVPVFYDGTSYWTASNATLFQGNAALTFLANPAQSWSTINGVFAAPVGVVIVATKSNGVYYSLNGGGAWTQVQPDHQGSVTVSYLCVSPAIATGIYLVGSDGYGYYTLNTSAGTLSRYGDSTTALYSASVSRIVLDTSSNVVLMGTNAKGLWRTVYDSGNGNVPASGQSWINE